MEPARSQIRIYQPMRMADWEEKLDGFLRFNGREGLTHAGTITAELANAHAEAQYEQFNTRRIAEDGAQDAFVEEARRIEGNDRNRSK